MEYLVKWVESNAITAYADPNIEITSAVEHKNSSHLNQELGPFCGLHDLSVKITDDIDKALESL